MSGVGTRAAGVGAITVVLAAVGGVILVGTGASAVAAGAMQLSRGEDSSTTDTTGVSAVDVQVSEADLTVRFDDVAAAQLETSGPYADEWRFEVQGDELIVETPTERWWSFGGGWPAGSRATLVLPMSLSGVDADLSLDAGSLSADGDFGDLVVDVSAGSLMLDGSADALEVDLSAGSADVTLDGVRRASYTLSAGRIESELLAVPAETIIDVSAGSLVLFLPDEEYLVERDVAAGSLESDLSESPDARNRIDATLSAGSIELRVGS